MVTVNRPVYIFVCRDFAFIMIGLARFIIVCGAFDFVTKKMRKVSTVLFWCILNYSSNFTYYWMGKFTLCTSLKLKKKKSWKSFIPSLQRRSPSITRCTSFTFFSKRSWVFKTFSRIPQTLLTVQRSWLDTVGFVPWTFTTRKVNTTKTSKYCMFSAHKLCFRMTTDV